MGGRHHLVTGGAGFIGFHLSERLLGRGDRVTVVDSFNDFYDPAVKRRNAADLARHAGFRLVEADIRDRDRMLALAGEGFETIIHLAAMAGVRPSIERPHLYADVNVCGTVNLLDLAVAGRVARLVFASSSSVYGANRRVPFSESDAVDHPVSPYAATKRAGELIAHTYHHLHGLPVTCLRFFTVYGPRQRPEMAVHLFTRLVDTGRPVPVFGDGTSSRDYTYVDDIIDGVAAAMDRGRGFGIYNLGESRTVSLAEMIAVIEKGLGRRAVIDRRPEQPGDVPATFADISAARRDLGYEPRTSFAEGYARFLAWYRGVGEAEGRP